MKLYLLDSEHQLIEIAEPDREAVIDWAQRLSEGEREVAAEKIGHDYLSTIFLGVDYSHGLDPHPLVFETAYFWTNPAGERDIRILDRWTSWETAARGHEAHARRLRLQVRSGKS